MKILENKKALYNYFILERIEVGIVLTGSELKSIRNKNFNFLDSYAFFYKGEIFLEGFHISRFREANDLNHEPLRRKKLLLHKREINYLLGKTKEKGLSLVPLSLYFNKKNKIKVLLGLARGKKLYDKRYVLAKKESSKQIERAFKSKNLKIFN